MWPPPSHTQHNPVGKGTRLQFESTWRIEKNYFYSILIPGGLDLPALFTESEVRSCSRATLFALLAAEEALSSAQLLMRPNGPEPGSEKSGSRPALGVDGERVGVAVGAGLPDLQDVVDTGALKYSRISPHFIPRLLLNMAAGQISIRYGLMVSFIPLNCLSVRF